MTPEPGSRSINLFNQPFKRDSEHVTFMKKGLTATRQTSPAPLITAVARTCVGSSGPLMMMVAPMKERTWSWRCATRVPTEALRCQRAA